MQRRAVLAAIAGLALGAPGRALARAQWDNSELLMNMPMSPTDTPQGIWQFRNKKVLMTQDVDGNKGKTWIRFTLLTPSGGIERRWKMKYGTHGQSLYATWDGDGFLVYTEQKDHRGLAMFEVSRDLSDMKFVREILPQTEKGRPVAFHVFGADGKNNTIMCAKLTKGAIVMRYYALDAFMAGAAVPLSDDIVIKERKDVSFGWLQGAGTYNGIGYLLVGDNKKKTKKRILRVAPDGSYDTIMIRAGRKMALFTYEPEALFVQNGRLIYGVYDYFMSRLYTLPVE